MQRISAPALALLGLLAGCGEQTLIGGLFFNTPAVTIPNLTAPNAPGVQLGPFTALLSEVVDIDTSDPTNLSASAITPITDVQASVVFESCLGLTGAAQSSCVSSGQGGTPEVLTVPESDADGGVYELLSTDQPALTFEEGVTYTMILQVPDGSAFDAYGARFQPGPPAHMVEFADKTQPVTLAAGTSLTVHRDDAPGPDGRLLPAAILVGQIDPNNPTSQPDIVYSSLDYTDPKTLALFALSDEPYRVPSFTIDGSVFTSSGFYVVTMISITEGKASANAFIASVVLAGSGDAGLLIVQ